MGVVALMSLEVKKATMLGLAVRGIATIVDTIIELINSIMKG